MLIIDLATKRVQSNQRFDTDVVILKGATDALINSLTQLAGSPEASGTPAKKPENYPLRPVGSKVTKVPLANRSVINKTVPESVKAQGSDFDATFAQISAILNGRVTPVVTKAKKVSNTFKKAVANRESLQYKLAKEILSSPSLIEEIRYNLQRGGFSVNPKAATVTTRNAEAIIALYAFYSTDEGFSSTEGTAKIESLVQISDDTLVRLNTELNFLEKTGKSISTRYFVTKAAAAAILWQVHQHPPISEKADALQEEIDTLVS